MKQMMGISTLQKARNLVMAAGLIKRSGGTSRRSLQRLYEKRQEEEERARMEKEAIIEARREERENAEARRKGERKNMLRRTRTGQPVMKYRIEHLLPDI